MSPSVGVFSSHSFWTSSSLDVPAGVTQEEGHTRFFIHLRSAVCALIFLARKIQPFLSLVDLEVEFLGTNDLIVLPSLGIFYFILFFCEKNPVYRDRTHVPTCQKVTRLPLSYRGDRYTRTFPNNININRSYDLPYLLANSTIFSTVVMLSFHVQFRTHTTCCTLPSRSQTQHNTDKLQL